MRHSLWLLPLAASSVLPCMATASVGPRQDAQTSPVNSGSTLGSSPVCKLDLDALSGSRVAAERVITVPAPGAAALVGMAAVLVRRRRS